MQFGLLLNCASIEGGRDNDSWLITMTFVVGAETDTFGFIQACEADVPQTAEHFHHVQRHVLQSLK